VLASCCVADTIYGFSSRILSVDGHPLPLAVNFTIVDFNASNDSRRRMPFLVQKISVRDVISGRSLSDDSVRYDLTAAVGKGKMGKMGSGAGFGGGGAGKTGGATIKWRNKMRGWNLRCWGNF